MSRRPFRLIFVFAVTLATAVFVIARVPAAAGLDDKAVKLSGCLVRGDGDGAGYLLINSPVEPSLSSTASASVAAPDAIGTTGAFANIFYWIDGDRSLKDHIGHRVEVEGYVKGDVKAGELKVDRKKDWTELEIKADGRTMKAQVPNTSIVAPVKDEKKGDVLVRKVDVEKVRMVAASCQ
jgi:hypothetical protein